VDQNLESRFSAGETASGGDEVEAEFNPRLGLAKITTSIRTSRNKAVWAVLGMDPLDKLDLLLVLVSGLRLWSLRLQRLSIALL
jgi:hypothetical protein